MANIPNARKYRARISNHAGGPQRTRQGPAPVPAATPRAGRFALLLMGIGVLSVLGGLKAALIGGFILAILLFSA